jgi:hypothetical protein
MRKVGGDKAADGFLAPRGAGEGVEDDPEPSGPSGA